MMKLEDVKQLVFGEQQDFKIAFSNPTGKRVLKRLAKYCRAHETTFHPDPYVSAALEGRREVYLFICEQLNLSPDELWDQRSKGKL